MDRQRWLRERLRFLHERLDAGPSDEERAAIEAELEQLHKERGGPGRLLRRLLGLHPNL
jgi:hypothetical protein